MSINDCSQSVKPGDLVFLFSTKDSLLDIPLADGSAPQILWGGTKVEAYNMHQPFQKQGENSKSSPLEKACSKVSLVLPIKKKRLDDEKAGGFYPLCFTQRILARRPHASWCFCRIVVPFVKTCLMVLPSVQTIWKSLTDVFITPLFESIGRFFAMINIRLDQE